jgi:hypothetical protein
MHLDRAIDIARRVILRKYGASLRAAPAPIWPAALALLAAHESAGRRWTTTKQQGIPPRVFREAGLTQRTTCPAPWRGDCEIDDIDPFDPTGNLWSAQRMAERARPAILAAVDAGGWDQPPLPSDLVAAMILAHSIGLRALAYAIREAGRAGGRTPASSRTTVLRALVAWIGTHEPQALGPWGTQSISRIRLRVRRAAEIVDRSHELGIGIPTTIDPCPPRPPGIPSRPPRLFERLDELATAAKREGDAASGPW